MNWQFIIASEPHLTPYLLLLLGKRPLLTV